MTAHLRFAMLYRCTVAVCQATGELPLDMLDGRPVTARAYVVEAVTRMFPQLALRQVLRWCGARNVEAEARRIAVLMWSPDWQDAIVEIGLAAMTPRDAKVSNAVKAERAAMAEAIATPAPRRVVLSAVRSPGAPASPYRRVIDRRVFDPVPLGEPAPGRSALDQRRQSEQQG